MTNTNDTTSDQPEGGRHFEAASVEWRLRQRTGLSHDIDVSIGLWPDQETMAADIWYDNLHFAEISEAEPEPIVEIFPRADGASWVFTAQELQSLLARVREQIQQLKKRPEPEQS
jgi:hypothetical protein